MTQVRTNLLNTREAARQIRAEPIAGLFAQTNIQKALEEIALSAGGAIPSGAVQTVTAAGTTIVSAGTRLLIFNKSAPSVSPVTLPSVLLRPDGLGLEIYDNTGLAGDITLTPFGTESIMGANSVWVIGSGGAAQTGGALAMRSKISILGWVAK